MIIAILGLFKGWSLLSSIAGWFTDAWIWAIKNPLAAFLAFALILIVTLGWYASNEASLAANAKANEAQAEKALTTERASNSRLTMAIAQQNAAFAQLGKDSASAVAQGDRADAAAITRSDKRAAQARAITITIPPASTGKPVCATPSDVMAAQGDL